MHVGPAALEAAAARAGRIVAFDAEDVLAGRGERRVHRRLAADGAGRAVGNIVDVDLRLGAVELHVAGTAVFRPGERERRRRLELGRDVAAGAGATAAPCGVAAAGWFATTRPGTTAGGIAAAAAAA